MYMLCMIFVFINIIIRLNDIGVMILKGLYL